MCNYLFLDKLIFIQQLVINSLYFFIYFNIFQLYPDHRTEMSSHCIRPQLTVRAPTYLMVGKLARCGEVSMEQWGRGVAHPNEGKEWELGLWSPVTKFLSYISPIVNLHSFSGTPTNFWLFQNLSALKVRVLVFVADLYRFLWSFLFF